VANKDRSNRRGLIRFLVVLVVLLAGCNLAMLIQSGIPARFVGSIGRAISRAEGIQVLIRTIQLGGTSPQDAAAELMQEGSELADSGEFEQALEAFLQANEIMPENPIIHLALAGTYEMLNQPEEAFAHLEQGLERDPENPALLRQYGRYQCMRDNREACVNALEKAVELEPDDATGHVWLALAYQQGAAGDLDRALAQYRKALEQDPDLGGAHMGLGYLFLRQPGQEVLALESFRRALEAGIRAGDEQLVAEARKELGNLYYGQDNYARCIEEMAQVLELDPDDADARRRLGLCYAMRGREGDLEQGVVELERALAATYDDLDLYYLYLGDYYAGQDDDARAVWAWEQFLRFSNDEGMKAEVQARIDSMAE
jgi:tetratricopeptide (TPR) repeat protein